MTELNKLPSLPLGERLSLSVGEALEATSLSRTTFYALVASGEIRTFTVGSRRFVTVDALRSWFEARESATTSVQAVLSEKRAAAGRLGSAARLARRGRFGPLDP